MPHEIYKSLGNARRRLWMDAYRRLNGDACADLVQHFAEAG